jgi:hypothetical protein
MPGFPRSFVATHNHRLRVPLRSNPADGYFTADAWACIMLSIAVRPWAA